MGAKASTIKYYDGSQYTGQVNDKGQQHGKGEINYVNGDHLQGVFADGDCTFAVLKRKNGSVYEGQMRKYMFYGKGKLITATQTQTGLFRNGTFIHGTVQYKDGSVYEGALQKHRRTGQGQLRDRNGDVYKGYFANDVFDGSGEYRKKDGTAIIGVFRNGKLEGEGELIQYENGRKKFVYKGAFREGLFDGHGDLKYSENNNHYVGHFKQGKKNGKGRFQYYNPSAEGVDIYEGNFVNDQKTDENCHIKKTNGTVYKGGILNGKYHGKGRLQKADGQYYEGYYSQGKKHGKGILKTNQFLFDGSFEDDKKKGRAIITYYDDDKKIIQAGFNEDNFDGQYFQRSSKLQSKVTYVNGKKHGPYHLKKLDENYQQKGTYEQDQRHGHITIIKGSEKAVYQYTNGSRGSIIDS